MGSLSSALAPPSLRCSAGQEVEKGLFFLNRKDKSSSCQVPQSECEAGCGHWAGRWGGMVSRSRRVREQLIHVPLGLLPGSSRVEGESLSSSWMGLLS